MVPRAEAASTAAAAPSKDAPARRRFSTGDETLDKLLDGGLEGGQVVLVEGDGGALSTEFVHALLHAARAPDAANAGWLSVIRSSSRVEREAHKLFPDSGELWFDALESGRDGVGFGLEALVARGDGYDVLVFESLSCLEDPSRGIVARLGDAASQRGALVILLHATGSISAIDDARIREQVDAHLRFSSARGGASARHTLAVPKLRGLSAALESAETPLLGIEFRRGKGLVSSRLNGGA